MKKHESNNRKKNTGNAKTNTPSKKKKSTVMKFIGTIVKMLLILAVVLGMAGVGLAGGVIYGYATQTEPLDMEDLQVRVATTFIYDDEDNEIAKLTGAENINREQVYYKDTPKYLGHAFVAVEDERYFKHFGVDIKGIIAAFYEKVTHPSSLMRGASTITQQVVRNLTGTFEYKIDRKIKEWWRAIQLERKLNKTQILEIYMNIIYMGENLYGVQSASKAYFGKDVSELSLAECALLAGITNEPGAYNPFTEKGQINSKKRQEIILKKMLELEFIDEREYSQAMQEELHFSKKEDYNVTIPIQSYFVDRVVEDVLRDLKELKGWSEDYSLTKLYNHGLKIYTTQNTAMQEIVDSVFTDDSFFYKDNTQAAQYGEIPQAATVVLDANTSQVKAMYGGYGEKEASRTYNRATHSKRQPGSSFKPIAVYGPALDLRLITPATIIDDVPVYMNTDKKEAEKPYPLNFDHTYGGLTSIRDGIKKSINVVAAKVWRDILGPDNSIEYLKRVGINRENEKYVSIAMGGLNEGVNPFSMAAAYVPFVNKGIYIKPVTYSKVLNSDGTVLLENKPEYTTVYDDTTAWLMTDMLKEVTRPGGTAPTCIVGDGKSIPTAGKTGTTSDNVDKWFVGYTPYYVSAVWYGYDNKIAPIEIAAGEERMKAQNIWTAVMNGIHAGLPAKDFSIPSGIVQRNICKYSGKISSDLCALDPRGSAVRQEYFIKGTEPAYGDICDVHIKARVCTECKDIWGRLLLEGSYCPVETVVEKVFIQRKEPYVPKYPDSKYPKDFIYELPAGEYCNIHGPSENNTEGLGNSTEGTANNTEGPANNTEESENNTENTTEELLE